MAVKKDRTESWKISDIASWLPEETVSPIEPQGDPSVSPSPERIKQLALQKRREYLNRNEGKPVKKRTFQLLFVAAIVALTSITAFAAFGGLDFIKGIFGDSAESIQDEIVTPQISASAQGRDMALEALVTDGYVTNMVISLTGSRPSDENLFTLAADISLRSNGWHVLDDFTKPGKTYYAVDLVSEQRFDTTAVTLSLKKEVAPIDLTIQIKNNLGNAVVKFPYGTASAQTTLEELQLSPMGFLLIGHEDNAQGGLPGTNIRLLFSNGKQEDIEVEFDASDEKVGGGGGAVIGGGAEPLPLVTTFHGTRNPDGKLVINGQFSRIINPAMVEKVVIGGVEYPVG